jgi:hypothetical protein
MGFLDDKRFWPIRARPGARRRSICTPRYTAVIEAYYKDYVEQYPSLLRAAWGFTVETATQGLRLVLSGVFDAYPGLKIILGHLGEGLPFYLWRISMGLARDGRGGKSFRDTFCEHFYITTSGFFSDPALLCCMMEMVSTESCSRSTTVCRQPARNQMDGNLAAVLRRQGKTIERQCQTAVEDQYLRAATPKLLLTRGSPTCTSRQQGVLSPARRYVRGPDAIMPA